MKVELNEHGGIKLEAETIYEAVQLMQMGNEFPHTAAFTEEKTEQNKLIGATLMVTLL